MTNQGSSATSAAKETAPSPPQGVWIVARSRKAACAKSSSATPCNGPKPMLLHKNKHNKKKNANAWKRGGPHGNIGPKADIIAHWMTPSEAPKALQASECSSLHSEACNALGASDGVIHSSISLEAVSLRASANDNDLHCDASGNAP